MPSEAGIADYRVSECDRKTVPRCGTRNRKCSTAVCGQSVTWDHKCVLLSRPKARCRGVWGEAAANKRFGSYWSQKSAALVAAVFVDIPKNTCNFLHKNSPISYGGSKAPYEEFSCSGSRHHCPVEIGAYAERTASCCDPRDEARRRFVT